MGWQSEASNRAAQQKQNSRLYCLGRAGVPNRQLMLLQLTVTLVNAVREYSCCLSLPTA